MKKWLIVFFTSAALLTSPVFASERADIGWEWIKQGAVIVDVRTPQEFAAGHLDNAKKLPAVRAGQTLCQHRQRYPDCTVLPQW